MQKPVVIIAAVVVATIIFVMVYQANTGQNIFARFSSAGGNGGTESNGGQTAN